MGETLGGTFAGGISWGNLRAAALCRRPRLAYNYDYACFVGFNGTLKAYMKKKSTTIMIMLLMMQIITQH